MRLFLSGLAAAVALLAGCASQTVPPIEGVVWQIDNEHTQPQGDWQKLGVKRLLVQWTVVDDLAFVPGTDVPAGASMPDWPRIAREPWAKEVILGLAGRFDERGARSRLEKLVAQSAKVARTPPPVEQTRFAAARQRLADREPARRRVRGRGAPRDQEEQRQKQRVNAQHEPPYTQIVGGQMIKAKRARPAFVRRLPAAQIQDAGLRLSRGRQLPDAAHPFAGSGPDRPRAGPSVGPR